MSISDWSADVCSSDLRTIVLDGRIDRLAGNRELAGDHGEETVAALGALLQVDPPERRRPHARRDLAAARFQAVAHQALEGFRRRRNRRLRQADGARRRLCDVAPGGRQVGPCTLDQRSEEHTSELQSLMRTSYAVFCLTTKTKP